MAFLALAMLAIGLSSRSSRERPSAGGSGIQAPRRQPGLTTFVLVLPDADGAAVADPLALLLEEPEASTAPCGIATLSQIYEQGCRLDRATGEVYSEPGSRLLLSANTFPAELPRLLPAQIEAVEPVALDSATANALTTGYDAAYDRAMSAAWNLNARLVEATKTSEPVSDDPMLQVFESLSRRDTEQPDAESYWTRLARRRWDYEVRAIFTGAANRLWCELEAVRVADDWQGIARQTGLTTEATVNYLPGTTWAEYEAWIGSKQWTVAGRDTQAGQGVAFWSQAKGELLQIAVARLNRVAELIHATLARFWNEAAERIAERVERAASAGVRN
jgi:hypothetical protein